MARVVEHLSVDELEAAFRSAADAAGVALAGRVSLGGP
jgi:hypothetical protein